MGYLANSEDPDEMPPKAAFHRGLHCFLAKDNLQKKKYTENMILFGNCNPTKYTIDHHKFIVSYLLLSERGIGRVKN